MPKKTQEPYATIFRVMQKNLDPLLWQHWVERNALRKITYAESTRWYPEQVEALIEGIATAIESLPLRAVLTVPGIYYGLIALVCVQNWRAFGDEIQDSVFHAVKEFEELPLDAMKLREDVLVTLFARLDGPGWHTQSYYIKENARRLARELVERWQRDFPVNYKVQWWDR